MEYEALWRALRELLERLPVVPDRATFLDECLDTLVTVLGGDRGLILLTDPSGATQAINARGRQRTLKPAEREEISRTIIRRALETGRPQAWGPGGADGESIASLGIVKAYAVPLRAPAREGAGEESEVVRGALYLDVRDPSRAASDLHVELFSAAADLIATVLEQRQMLIVAREDLREARARQTLEPTAATLDDLLGTASLDPLRAEVASCLSGGSPIVILGESGTGKTLLAQAIAEASGRLPIVRAVLGQSDDLNTITSELFGHERGAFSGAMASRKGLVEFANGGTLILDEILNLPLQAQQLLLDFAQFGTYRPLGHGRAEPKKSLVRLIAVTNGDLKAATRDGRFREDLYYRLAHVVLHVPSLRQRRADIPYLAEGYLRRSDPQRAWRLALPLRRLLASDDLRWSGNIRQLEIVMERARQRALSRDPKADLLAVEHTDPADLGCASLQVPSPADAGADDPSGVLCRRFQVEPDELKDSFRRLLAERAALEDHERTIISMALSKHRGVVAFAARELHVSRTGLRSRMRTLGLERDDE